MSPARLPAAAENAYRKFLGGGIADLRLRVLTGRSAERTTWHQLDEFLLEYD